MEQTQTHSDWYTRFVAEVRAETEHLMDAYQDMAAPTTAQEVERAARALLWPQWPKPRHNPPKPRH